MNRYKNITGQKFNKLIAISFIKRENKKTYWSFQCDCGEVIIKNSHEITRNKIKSCGCLLLEHLKILANKQRLPNQQSLKNRLLRRYKREAKIRNYSFELSSQEFENLISQKCFYCGSEPSNLMKEGESKKLHYNGIDRLDNSIGYNLENCVPCCAICNKLKMNLDKDQFLKQIKKISLFLKL